MAIGRKENALTWMRLPAYANLNVAAIQDADATERKATPSTTTTKI